MFYRMSLNLGLFDALLMVRLCSIIRLNKVIHFKVVVVGGGEEE